MDLDLRLVRYFVAVAEELHFGRAASRLYLSQPALSKQIRKLEDQLKAPLFTRDSRHVILTARGQRFLEDARELLATADRMQRPSRTGMVRIAHVFELETTRAIADAYAAAHPDVELLEHAMDSITQLNALLQHRLDVAVLRITPRMLVEHPQGWDHCLLRLEPLLLVGRPDGEEKDTASLYEGPLEVFGDPPESGSFNAHGMYLKAFERELDLSMRWLGTPGAFSHCLAHRRRATGNARSLEFQDYAQRYAAAGLPVYRPEEVQPYYPWSLAWRTNDPSTAVAELLDTARQLAREWGWLEPWPDPAARPWLPADDPVYAEALPSGSRQGKPVAKLTGVPPAASPELSDAFPSPDGPPAGPRHRLDAAESAAAR